MARKVRSVSAIGEERIKHMQTAKAIADTTIGANNLYNSRKRWRRPDLRPVWMYDKEYAQAKVNAVRSMRQQEEKENDLRKQEYSSKDKDPNKNRDLTGFAIRQGGFKYSNYKDGNKRQKVNEKSRWYQ